MNAKPSSAPLTPAGAPHGQVPEPPGKVALRLARERMEDRAGETGTANTAMRLFVSELDHRVLYDQALSVTLDLLHLSAGMLFLYDDAAGAATLRAQRGIAPAVAERFRVCTIGAQDDDILSRCVRERRMVTITAGEAEALAEASEVLGLGDLSAVAARPLLVGRQLIGVLLVCASKGRWALIGQNLARFHALADSLAVAVGHEQLFAEKLEQVTTELIAVLSHEFRTPLTSILGYSEALSDGDAGALSGAQRDFVEIIESSARRLQRQVEHLLTLSRIQEGTLPFTPRPLALAEAVASVLSFLAPRIEAHGMQVHSGISARLPAVMADPRALDQIFFHLLDNALKFAPPGSEVYVRAMRDGDWLMISVMNTGSTIAPEEQAALFSAFYKATEARDEVAQGTGVGLAIVRGLVERHGGRVWVESAGETGTTFFFTLPVNPAECATQQRGGGSSYGPSAYRG